MAEANIKHKDRVFRMLFGYEKYKENLLELFNALNDTAYTNPDDLEINTLDDVFYMKMKNDVSCIIDNRIAIYEHQSTWNYNMPLRGFRYTAELYNKFIMENDLDVYRRKMIKLPTPQYVVFYNGLEKRPEKEILRLSDSFIMPCSEGEYEWTATVYNINDGHNKDLMNKCKILQEYATMVAKIREFRQKGCELDMAIEEAIEYCLLHDVLKDFLLENKSEVADMLRMEYDEARTMNHLKEDYYEEGVKDGETIGAMKAKISLICRNLSAGITAEQIAEFMGEDISFVRKVCDAIGDNPEKCDVDEVVEKLIKG
ncbi:hypothetical protein DWW96_09965 [Eubacterium sp. AF17-7]|uniref:hypothetical protein n=1 Tax=Eubacterium sp. AF17-7 TaxID=2293105 RepID=UPI000E4BC578|nr:hypothetical protein [Eubacterium sp. AF17-7]RGG64012.1 hypothetical protein DWW96_09965 [Eubacterium sp. AF17-7]